MSLVKIFAAPALIAALALSAPASAQRYHDNGDNLRREIAQLDRQIDRLQDRRMLSQRDARTLDRQVDGLERTWRNYARGGFSQSERRNLSSQIARVKYAIDRQARDSRGRNDRFAHRR